MMTRDLVHDLFNHMEWADARVWSVVFTTEVARNDERVRAVLVHLHSAQRAFLDAWMGQPPAFRQASDFPQLSSVYEFATSYYAPAREFLETLDEATFAETLRLPWAGLVEERIGKAVAPTTLGETALQVFSHTTHHRAQISSRIRALGGEPPLVDYIAWLWLGRPQPEWPQGAGAPVR